MATAAATTANFSLSSKWTVAGIAGGVLIMDPPPSTASTKKTFTLTGIPAGATINSATLTATLGSPLTGAAINQYAVLASGNQSMGSSRDVKAHIQAAFNSGTRSFEFTFRFKANGAASAPTGTKTSILTYADVMLSVVYTPPMSDLSLNKASFDAGTALRSTISPPVSGNYHRLEWTFGSRSSSVTDGSFTASGSDFYYDITPSTSWLDQIPAALKGTLTVKLHTYSNSGRTNLLGTVTKTASMTVGSGIKPAIGSVGLTRDDNGVPGGWGRYVQGYSRVTVSIDGAEAGAGSTIASYRIYCKGVVDSARESRKTDPLPAGTHVFTATVVDARGRTATKDSAAITVWPYAKPNVRSITAIRANSGGAADDEGAYGKASVSYTFASVDGKNSTSVEIKYRKGTSGGWTVVHDGALASGSAVNFGGALDEFAHQVRFTVTDGMGNSATFTGTIPSVQVFMHYRAGGLGLGIGKYCDTDKRVQIADDWQIGGAKATTEFFRRVDGLNTLDCGTQNISESNLNLLEDTGLYYGYTLINGAEAAGFVLVLGRRAGDTVQLFFKEDGTKLYFRGQYRESWSAWKQVDTL